MQYIQSLGDSRWCNRMLFLTVFQVVGVFSTDTAHSKHQATKIWHRGLELLIGLSGLNHFTQWATFGPEISMDQNAIAGCQGPLQLLEPHVNTIRDMIEQIIETAKKSIQTPPDYVGISQPLALSQSQTWLFSAATQQANLTVISQGWHRDTSTAFVAPAAYGIGMCEHHRTQTTCSEEQRAMKSENILVIEYTSLVFSAQFLWYFDGSLNPKDEDYIYSSTDLGKSSRWRSDVGDETYWLEVCARTRSMIETSSMFPTKLIFVGDRAADRDVVHAVRDCLGAMRPHTVLGLVNDEVIDPVFAASMGAARIVKSEMESAGGCTESKECYIWRGEK